MKVYRLYANLIYAGASGVRDYKIVTRRYYHRIVRYRPAWPHV
jgi:hypothetical protein